MEAGVVISPRFTGEHLASHLCNWLWDLLITILCPQRGHLSSGYPIQTLHWTINCACNLAFYVQGPTGKKINHHLGIDKWLSSSGGGMAAFIWWGQKGIWVESRGFTWIFWVFLGPLVMVNRHGQAPQPVKGMVTRSLEDDGLGHATR